MSSNRTLMVLPGDGVGPEVVKETLRVVDWFAKYKSILIFNSFLKIFFHFIDYVI